MTSSRRAWICLTLLATSALAGCSNDVGPRQPIQGYSVKFESRAADYVYVKAWTSDMPEAGGTPAVADRMNPPGTNQSIDASNPFWFLAGCDDGMTHGYLKVSLQDPSQGGAGLNSYPEIRNVTWDDLRCGHWYTVIIDESENLALYPCDPCKGTEKAWPIRE